jgi:HlyD family secretion protein
LRVPLQALQVNPSRSSTAPGPQTVAGKTQRHVWVLSAGRPVPLPVTVGIEDGTYAQITGGDLKAGDPVIVNEIPGGSRRSKDGQRSRFPFHF